MAVSPVLKGGKAPVNPEGPRGEERGRVFEAAWLCLHLFPANEQGKMPGCNDVPSCCGMALNEMKLSISQPLAPTTWLPIPENSLSGTDFPTDFQQLRHLCPSEALPWQSNLVWKPSVLSQSASATFQLSPAAVHIPRLPQHDQPRALSVLS